MLDPLQDVAPRSLALAELQPCLEGDDARARVAEVDLALEAVERLHLLDRVALDRRAQRLPDGPQQVDEDALAQESIDLCLPRAVAAHEALERCRLVGRVVIDVHRRVRGEASHEEVDQLLERASLAVERELPGVVARPDGVERPVHVENAEEVVEAVVERIRIAFDIEEQVAR